MSAFGGVSNSLHTKNNPVPRASDTVAPTTEYVADFTEKLRNFSQNDIKFEISHNQSRVLEEMVMDEDASHVVYGTAENPQHAVIEDDSLIEGVWEGRNGEYDDFNQFLGGDPKYDMSIDDADTSLEGEEMDDFDQRVLARAQRLRQQPCLSGILSLTHLLRYS